MGRLTPREAYDRAHRMKVSLHASAVHKDLLKDQWISAKDVCRSTSHPVTVADSRLTGRSLPQTSYRVCHQRRRGESRLGQHDCPPKIDLFARCRHHSYQYFIPNATCALRSSIGTIESSHLCSLHECYTAITLLQAFEKILKCLLKWRNNPLAMVVTNHFLAHRSNVWNRESQSMFRNPTRCPT